MEHDLCAKEFYSDDERYADLINGIGCGGKQIVKKEDLQPLDTHAGIYKLRGFQRRWQGKRQRAGTRDLIRRTAFGMNFAVIGIENQEELDYALSLRTMSYDVREYEAQAAKIRRKIRKSEKRMTSGEYLYGFAKDSRIHPVITFVLYYGEKEWDASRDLHGIIDFSEIPKPLRSFVQNYQVHLVEVRKLQDTSVFHTDIRQVFDFIRCSNDPQKLKELVESDPAYQNLEEDAYDMAVLYAQIEVLAEKKELYREKGGINMCKGAEGLIQMGKEEGIAQGIRALIETCEEFGAAKAATIDKIIQKFSIPTDQAEKYVEEYWRNQP